MKQSVSLCTQCDELTVWNYFAGAVVVVVVAPIVAAGAGGGGGGGGGGRRCDGFTLVVASFKISVQL